MLARGLSGRRVLIGARDGVDVAVRTLQALAPTKGLVLQPHKCVVTSICQAEAMAMADAHGFKLEPDGVQVLGAAVGNDALLRSIASVTTAKLVGWARGVCGGRRDRRPVARQLEL